MLDHIDLRPLAELDAPERAFLSFYASGPQGARALDRQTARIGRLLADQPAEREHFEASLALLDAWLRQHPVGDSHVAVFTCGALDFTQGWNLPVGVPNLLRVGATPYLRPLAELKDEYGSLAVVAADNRVTRIYSVAVDRATLEQSVRGDIKNAVKKGGWSQQRYARRREKQLERYADEVVDVLASLDRETPFDRVVLVGTRESLREIEAQIPSSLRDRVFRRDGFNLAEGEQGVAEAGWDQWFAEERAEEAQLWDRIRSAALGHGLAALGPTDVLTALRAGRVDTMIVDRDAKVAGTRCRACEQIVHGAPDTCQTCGSSDVFQVDLVNELVRLAEVSSAEVEFAEPIRALAAEGGVGALLRF